MKINTGVFLGHKACDELAWYLACWSELTEVAAAGTDNCRMRPTHCKHWLDTTGKKLIGTCCFGNFCRTGATEILRNPKKHVETRLKHMIKT